MKMKTMRMLVCIPLHARSVSTNKKCINDQLGYYGVPKDAVECFIKTCPQVIILLLFYNAIMFSAHC
jgi:hypothetical protein